MNKEKFLLVGSGGRESAFAKGLAEDTELYAVIAHKNPTIIENVYKSGGEYCIANPSDPGQVSEYAKKHNVDYAFVSADEPLASGVVDALLAAGIKAVGGTKEATKIEWDKIYSIELVHELCPEFTPDYKIIDSIENIYPAVKYFEDRSMQVVVKPQGLTGGKGVKVMPEHLKNYEEAANYAKELLNKNPGEKVLLVEKLVGIEFTIMGLTDGKSLVLSPASYDYPFREEGDKGPGTGGMGCFTHREKHLPFMTAEHLRDCGRVMQRVIDSMRERNLLFNGVLNGGFFITQHGIRFMEFNGRFGDPEGLNVISILKSPFSQLIKDMYHKALSEDKVIFVDKASVITYIVAKEYPAASKEATRFCVDTQKIEASGANVFFSAAESIQGENAYITLQSSRVLAIGAVAENIEEAAKHVNDAIRAHVQLGDNLDYRSDIGSKESLTKLQTVYDALH